MCLWFKRFILEVGVPAEGTVDHFWNEDMHVIEDHPEADYHYGSIDYGTGNATCAGLFSMRRVAPILGTRRPPPRVWLKASYSNGRETGRQKTDGEYADDLVVFDRGTGVKYLYLDPSAASLTAELQQRGFTVLAAHKDVLNGIWRQAQMLRSGEYQVCVEYARDPGVFGVPVG